MLASDLHALFVEGVTVFREQLKRRVETDATKHFLRLTTEPDYAGLRINDSYGLTIVHRDGTGNSCAFGRCRACRGLVAGGGPAEQRSDARSDRRRFAVRTARR